MLLEEFLKPAGLTQQDLARGILVPFQRVNEIVRGRRGVSAATALRLAKFFGTTAEFWLNLQACWDMWHAQRAEASVLKRIRTAKPRKR
jgi:addiction module HigA family antidote